MFCVVVRASVGEDEDDDDEDDGLELREVVEV